MASFMADNPDRRRRKRAQRYYTRRREQRSIPTRADERARQPDLDQNVPTIIALDGFQPADYLDPTPPAAAPDPEDPR